MTKDEAGNEIEVPPITAQQILARTRERKAKSTLLMAILDEHLARFHGIKDAKTLWAAIKTRFGESTSSTNELNAAFSVFTTTDHSSQAQGSSSYADKLMFSFFANQSSTPQLDKEDLEQIDQDDLEEMDLKWQVAMLSMTVRQFYKKTKRKIEFNGKEPVGFDKNKEDEQALVVQDGLGTYDWSYQVEEEATDFALMAFTSNHSSSLSSNSEVQSCFKQCEQSYEQLKTLFDKQREKLSKANIKIIGYQCVLKSIKRQLLVHQQNEVIYEEKIRVLEYQGKDKSNLLKYTQKQLVEALKEKEDLKAKLEKFETSSKNVTKLLDSQISAKVRTDLGYDSQFNEKEVLDIKEEEVTETVFDNQSSDEENSVANNRFKNGKGYHAVLPPLTGNYMPPKPDLSFAGLVDSIYKFKISETVTSLAKDEKDAPKTSIACVEKPKEDRSSAPLIEDWETDMMIGHTQQALKNKGIVDSGCFRYMIGNKAYLADYQEIHDGGFVAFGSSRGKIIGKGKIRIEKLDFADVYFVNELKFNLFSVSQMCDKKNSVLFTETKCLVLSPNFKLFDESQVLLRVPRQSNMYSFDLQNVVSFGDLTCLFAKSSINESNLWHVRLGHVNFKTMNKLVKGNLVRGLPSKIFNNDHSCVACQKRKQHKATYKAKFVSSISQPLQILHMDLFGPTSVMSINHKKYCLVVTDDCSRFSWVFFLATKDETKFKNRDLDENLRVKLMREFWLGTLSLVKLSGYLILKSEKLKRIWNQTDKNAGPQDTNGNAVNKEDQAYRDELDRLMSLEKEASNVADALRKEFKQGCMDKKGVTQAGSTNSFNMEPKKVSQALDNESWVEAMQEELLQFSLQKNLDSKKILMYQRFLQLFLNNQIKDLPEPFNDTYETPKHSKKVFSNMARKRINFSRKVTPLFDSMLVQNQEHEGKCSTIPTEPQPTPSTSQPNISATQTAPLQTATHPTVSYELQIEAHIKQILPFPSTYQRKHRKTHKPKKAKKATELPQTSMPLGIGAYEAIYQEGGDSVEKGYHY
nr:putative ribonuclease H-like domain-containing protein [Tanacetum cinerariifolium]